MNREAQPDILRITILVVTIALLLAASLWMMAPFLGSLTWATAVVLATWPPFLRLQRLLGGRRSLATAIMTIVIMLVFIVPFWLAIDTLLDATERGITVARAYLTQGLPPPPAWIAGVPVVGARIAGRWQELSAGGSETLVKALQPYASSAATWMLSVTGGFGGVLVHFLLTVILAGILYARGDIAAEGVRAFARKLGAERGERFVNLAGQTMRGVALGVVVTAVVQSTFAGLGLWASGVPFPGLLTAAVFMLRIAQLGPFLVMVPVVIWLYLTGSIGGTAALLVWTLFVGIMDNFLRPVLIKRSVDLPLLLIIAGVVGGIIGFGVIGLFVGPVVLAVTYSSLEAWVRGSMPPPPDLSQSVSAPASADA